MDGKLSIFMHISITKINFLRSKFAFKFLFKGTPSQKMLSHIFQHFLTQLSWGSKELLFAFKSFHL